MFRTFPLSIICSFSLYTQQWCMSYRFVDSLRAGSGWNVFHCVYSEKLQIMDRGTLRNMQSFIQKINLRNFRASCWFYNKKLISIYIFSYSVDVFDKHEKKSVFNKFLRTGLVCKVFNTGFCSVYTVTFLRLSQADGYSYVSVIRACFLHECCLA